MSSTSKVGVSIGGRGGLNLPPPARFVEMLTNEIIFSDEKIIRIYGILTVFKNNIASDNG